MVLSRISLAIFVFSTTLSLCRPGGALALPTVSLVMRPVFAPAGCGLLVSACPGLLRQVHCGLDGTCVSLVRQRAVVGTHAAVAERVLPGPRIAVDVQEQSEDLLAAEGSLAPHLGLECLPLFTVLPVARARLCVHEVIHLVNRELLAA